MCDVNKLTYMVNLYAAIVESNAIGVNCQLKTIYSGGSTIRCLR